MKMPLDSGSFEPPKAEVHMAPMKMKQDAQERYEGMELADWSLLAEVRGRFQAEKPGSTGGNL